MKKMKRFAAVLLSLCLCMLAAACGNQRTAIGADSAAQSSQQAEDSEVIGMPNPWVEVESQQEAEKQAGYAIALPQTLPEGYGEPSFLVTPGEIVEAYYAGAGEARLCVRKAAGTDDASGDYREYPESQQVTVGDLKVTMKGDNGEISLAVWQDGTNAYSIGIYGGVGLTVEEMSQMVSEMME